VQFEIAEELALPVSEIHGRLEDGSALAALAADHVAAHQAEITGSPTFLLNEGRQKLYGNIGYRILDANIQELLTDNRDRASWC
jgi:predicted DsbA family dithiol-disulfide isomerase